MDKEQSGQQFGNSRNSFDLSRFIARQERDVARLAMAAWGVGGRHSWFRALPRAKQVEKVQEWVAEALDHAELRRVRMAASSD